MVVAGVDACGGDAFDVTRADAALVVKGGEVAELVGAHAAARSLEVQSDDDGSRSSSATYAITPAMATTAARTANRRKRRIGNLSVDGCGGELTSTASKTTATSHPFEVEPAVTQFIRPSTKGGCGSTGRIAAGSAGGCESSGNQRRHHSRTVGSKGQSGVRAAARARACITTFQATQAGASDRGTASHIGPGRSEGDEHIERDAPEDREHGDERRGPGEGGAE